MRGMEHEVQMAVIRPLDEHLPNGMPSGDDGCAVVVRLRSRFHASRQMAPEKAGLDPVCAGLEGSGLGECSQEVCSHRAKEATIGQMAYLQHGNWRIPRAADCGKLGTCWQKTQCLSAKPRITFE